MIYAIGYLITVFYVNQHTNVVNNNTVCLRQKLEPYTFRDKIAKS